MRHSRTSSAGQSADVASPAPLDGPGVETVARWTWTRAARLRRASRRPRTRGSRCPAPNWCDATGVKRAPESVSQHGPAPQQEIVCDGDRHQAARHGLRNIRPGAVVRFHQAGEPGRAGTVWAVVSPRTSAMSEEAARSSITLVSREGQGPGCGAFECVFQIAWTSVIVRGLLA